jgi:hypothetical protein
VTLIWIQLLHHREELLHLIHSHPTAKLLWEELHQFFPSIALNPVEGESSSNNLYLQREELRPKIEWPAMQSPQIAVAVNSGRELEAAVHEMLHLKLAISGFAKPCINTYPYRPSEREEFLRTLDEIEHQITLPLFRAMGFPSETFLPPGDARQLPCLPRFNNARAKPDSDEWSRGVIEYFSATSFGREIDWGQFREGVWQLRPGTNTSGMRRLSGAA